MPRRASRWLPLVVLGLLAVVYGSTLAPGLSWANDGADGGDLIAAAATGGVPHPTGYPLYLLLANGFQQLPVGELAFRTNLMSAVFACLAALFVYLVTHHLTSGSRYQQLSAFIAALIFGLAPLAWSQAVISEVHTLQSFSVALILYQAFVPRRGKAFLFFRGLLVGLALGNHATSLFLLPILLWQEDSLRVRPLLPTSFKLMGLAIGLSIYVILPLRAMGHPPINWENPVTLDGFLGLVTGRLYQSYLSSEFVVERLRGWSGLLLDQFGLAGAAIGIYALLEGRKMVMQVLPLVWIFLGQSLFSLFYSPRDSYLYLIAPALVLSIWIGLGISSLLSTSTRIYRVLAFFLILLFLGEMSFSTARTFNRVDASRDSRAEDFGREIMVKVPEGSLVFTRDDRSTFSLWYFHFALKERADARVIAEALLPYDWYRQSLRDTYPDLNLPDRPIASAKDVVTFNPALSVCLVGYQGETLIQCTH